MTNERKQAGVVGNQGHFSRTRTSSSLERIADGGKWRVKKSSPASPKDLSSCCPFQPMWVCPQRLSSNTLMHFQQHLVRGAQMGTTDASRKHCCLSEHRFLTPWGILITCHLTNYEMEQIKHSKSKPSLKNKLEASRPFQSVHSWKCKVSKWLAKQGESYHSNSQIRLAS